MAVPDMVQHVSTSSSRSGSFTDNGYFRVRLPNGTQAGNCLVVCINMGIGTSLSMSVDDDQGNTWASITGVNNSSNGQSGRMFYALNVAANTRVIRVQNTSGSDGNWTQVTATEFYNVATASAIDGNNSHTATSATTTAGSFTPGTTGDLLVQMTARVSSVSVASFTAGSQANITWKLLSADVNDGMAVQWGVYNSTSAINPSMTMASSTAYVSCGLALKSASAGSARPAGIYIVGTHHESQDTTFTSDPQTIQVPSLGNLLVMSIVMAVDTDAPAGITDSAGNTWAQAGSGSTGSDGSWATTWYATNATTSATLTITVNYPGALGAGGTLMVYDVIGAATSAFDTSGFAIGTQSSPGNITAASVTPTTANGVVFGNIGVSLNTMTGLTGSGHLFDSIEYDGIAISGPQNCDQNNGWGHYYNPNTSAVQFTFTQSDGGLASQAWGAYAAAFKAAAGETITVDKWYGKIPDVARRKRGVVASGTTGIKA